MIRHLLIGAVLATAMVLWLRSSGFDEREHVAYQGKVSRLAVVHGEMEQRLLRARVGLLGNYDSFHTGQAEHARMLEELKSTPSFVTAENRPLLLGAVERLESSLRRQVELIDHFKTTNALVMNSRSYFPVAARELNQTPNAELAVLAQEASVEVIRLNTANESASRSLADISRRLRNWAESHGSNPEAQLALGLSRHAKLLAQGEGSLRRLVREILELPTKREVAALGKLYAGAISKSLRRSEQQHRYLLLLGVFCLGLLGYTGWSMWRTNHELELRVQERTTNLRENQARFELALEGTNDGIWEWNPTTNEVYYAPRFREMLGVTREEFPDTFEAWRDRLHPDDVQPTMKLLKAHLEKREPYQVDHRLQTHAGEYRIFHARGQAVWTEEGNPVRMAGSILDVTDQRNAEEQVDRLLSMQRGILDSAEIGIIATDPQGVISTCNRKVADLFGYGLTELIGWESPARLLSHRELVSRAADLSAEFGEEIKPGIDALIARARRENQLDESEWTMLRKNRETFPALITVTILRDVDDDSVDGYLFVIHDLTEIKIAEAENQDLIEQLQTANHELSNFAYVVSHDLKAPLRAIASLADWLEMDYADKLDDEGRKQLRLLNGRARRMNSLIDGVLEYSRAGRTSEAKELVDIYQAVQEVIDLLAPPEHISVTIEGPLPSVVTEPIRIRQVFQNLISNAIKYMDKDEGRVLISAKKEDRFWRFSIADNGPGIDRKYHDRIFGLFKTLERRDDKESTGVGLSIVEKIVVANQGSIWIESEVGQGATFHFTLPIKPKD